MILWASVLLFSTGFASAGNIVVDTTADAVDALPGDALCLSSAMNCTLRAAIQEANALPGADRIVLTSGTYLLTLAGSGEDSTAVGDLDVRDALVIEGAGIERTSIDAGALDRVLDMHPPGVESVNKGKLDIALRSLTIRNGLLIQAFLDGTAQGAGIRIGANVTLRLHDVVIRDNVLASFGGAAGIDSRGCVIGERVRILDNRDPNWFGNPRATAVSLGPGSCLSLSNSEISGNRGAAQAGAIYASDTSSIVLREVLIHDNAAGVVGGLLLNAQNSVLIENSTLSFNHGNSAGAVLNDGGSTLTLRHCTVTGNGGGNGIFAIVGGIHDVHGGAGRVGTSNSIIAGNGPASTADCKGVHSDSGGNLIGSLLGCSSFIAQPSDQVNVDPELAAIGDNGGFARTHLPGLPAIDRAVESACLGTDQRLQPRPADGDDDGIAQCDIGAVELDSPLLVDGFESIGNRGFSTSYQATK
jgi:CSLREA domain-containing protein